MGQHVGIFRLTLQIVESQNEIFFSHFFVKMAIFSLIVFIFEQKFFNKNKIFRQFSDSQKYRGMELQLLSCVQLHVKFVVIFCTLTLGNVWEGPLCLLNRTVPNRLQIRLMPHNITE